MRSPLKAVFCILTFAGGFSACSLQGQTARKYYEELYKASALDGKASQYVCFDEDQALETFFIFADSSIYKQQFLEAGKLQSLASKERKALEKGFLIVRAYNKGVAVGDVDFYDKDADFWIRPFELDRTPMQMRLTVTQGTLRYKRSVEFLRANGSLKRSIDRFGRCEPIPPPPSP